MRNRSARAAARLSASLSRKFGGGGATALPGLVGLKMDPGLVRKGADRLAGTIVVTGTNGKTTTSRFIGAILKESGIPFIHNQSGSNLLRGIASTIATAPELTDRHWGLFEVDEATMPAACKELRPDVVVVTNLFRDQLDRYGELKRTAELLAAGLAYLPKESTVVLNADDPLVSSLGQGLAPRTLYYGIADSKAGHKDLPHAADAVSDPATGQLLEYDRVFVGHLGHYRSPGRDANRLVRPKPDVTATRITLDGIKGSRSTLGFHQDTEQLHLSVPGLYNVYNALAAASAGAAAGFSPKKITKAITDTDAAFGRLERVKIGKKEVFLGLIKNPTGANEVMNTLALEKGKKDVLVAINDWFADGTDVSWLWDADFETLLPGARSISVAGSRAADMAVRFKYAGVPEEQVTVYDSASEGLTECLKKLPDGGTLYVLPTYTAMLELRRALTKSGHLKHYLS
jgi:UDP-N-acetylmuramyl tripeptide synthase